MKINTFLLCILLSLLCNSCLDESTTTVEENLGVPVTINFSPMRLGADKAVGDFLPNSANSPDKVIKEFRVLIFRSNGHLTYVKKVADVQVAGSNPVTINMHTGNFDFVFLANEGSDAVLSATLDGFAGTITSLEQLSFAASAFDKEKNIPMIAVYRGVDIGRDGTATTISGEGITAGQVVGNNWTVPVKHLGVRVDLSFVATAGFALNRVEIANLPSTVPLLQQKKDGTTNYNNSAAGGGPYAAVRTLLPTAFIEKTTADRTTWAIDNAGANDNRIILPANLFADKNDSTRAIAFHIYLDGFAKPFIGRLGNPGLTRGGEVIGYTSPANSLYDLRGDIHTLYVQLGVSDWATQVIDGNLSLRELNVSSLEKQVYEDIANRIYFNSNQQQVTLEPIARDMYGATLDVSKLLENPTSPENFSYDALSGAGYLNLKLASTAIPGTYKVYLNANGLRREITLWAVRKSNSYMLLPNGAMVIPVARANESFIQVDGSTYQPATNTYEQLAANTPWQAVLVWESTPGLISIDANSSTGVGYTGEQGCFKVFAQTQQQGNAVVAIKNSAGEILWSWHLWVTTYNGKTQFNFNNGKRTYQYMDRLLGATSNVVKNRNSCGLHYQWGRKDPFPGIAQDGGAWSTTQLSNIKVYNADGVAYSFYISSVTDAINFTNALRKPDTFYASHSYYDSKDWIVGIEANSANYNNLWAGGTKDLTTLLQKSVFDPCPIGWRVPPMLDDTSPVQGLLVYEPAGNYGAMTSAKDAYFPDCGWYWFNPLELASAGQYSRYWFATAQGTRAFSYGIIGTQVQPEPLYTRSAGLSIRCCKESF